jgi:hypothetical protein
MISPTTCFGLPAGPFPWMWLFAVSAPKHQKTTIKKIMVQLNIKDGK